MIAYFVATGGVSPDAIDPEQFLRAVILATDPAVTTRDRMRARKLLTRRRAATAPMCVCFATLKPRDELEFREWIDEVRETNPSPKPYDAQTASLVRLIARGEELEPWGFHKRTINAFNAVVSAAVAEALAGNNLPASLDHDQGQDDATILPFWEVLLAADDRVTPKERLDAFAALDEADVLPRCGCEPENLHLWEEKADALHATITRTVAQKHYRAAVVIALNPETYLAVRDAIDDAVAAAAQRTEAGHRC